MEDKKCSEIENRVNGSRSESSSKGANVMANKVVDSKTTATIATNMTTTTTTTQSHRKARRCWSPDLHRRFVNALQKLGGSQVATPKQIREMMKVDGLTNDEVKSHLQKYRLHTRRPSPSPQAGGAPAPQLVVLGGIWVPPEYATVAAAAHGSAPTIYGAHPQFPSPATLLLTTGAPRLLCASTSPHSTAAPPPPCRHSSPDTHVQDHLPGPKLTGV
ncbi:hypothetical protein Ancab_006940 [Ancistrocladus abbreviatus]